MVSLVLLSGCAAPGSSPLFGGSDTAVHEEGESCSTTEKCAEQLRKMIKDPKRDWIGRPQSPEIYANGTRLFAYRALRKKLTCNELKRALEDATATPSLLPAQYERVRVLATAVAQELKSEQDKRCRSRPAGAQ